MAGTLKVREVKKQLVSKFGFTTNKRQDHPEFELVVDGTVLATTHVSHGTKGSDLGTFHIKMMSRQLGVSAPQFRNMISCTMSKEDYMKVVADSK